MARKPVVATTIKAASSVASIKGADPIVVLYTKFSIQSERKYQVSGRAMALATTSKIINSLISKKETAPTDAPSTFLIPISFDLRSAVNEINPKVPKQAMIMARTVKMVNTNEYKRFQAPPILRISSKAFGFGRRMPLVARYS